jgi:hypothetical protein
MAFIGQLFSLRRSLRKALGLPMGEWEDEDLAHPGFLAVWNNRLRRFLRNSVVQGVVATMACAELTFAMVAVPGGQGVMAEHRQHARQAWEYLRSFGSYADVSTLWCAPDTTRSAGKPGAS